MTDPKREYELWAILWEIDWGLRAILTGSQDSGIETLINLRNQIAGLLGREYLDLEDYTPNG